MRKTTYKGLSREIVGIKSPLLYDRFFFSAMIYDGAYNREPTFNWSEQIHIGRCLNAFKAPVVFCVPPLTDILKMNLSSDEEEGMDGLTTKITEIYNTYVSMGTLMMSRRTSGMKPIKNKHGVSLERTPRDYALPPVTWYDYNKPKDYSVVKTRVLEYLSYRALRSSNWIL